MPLPDVIASLNWYSLLAIGLFVSADLGLRLWIFGRLESIALDVSLFSFVYCITEVFRMMPADGSLDPKARHWLVRLAILFIVIVILSIIHTILNSSLRDLLDEMLEAVDDKSDDETRKLLHLAKPLIRRSVVLTFVGPETPFLRKGKKNWRDEAAKLVNQLAGQEALSADALLLPSWQRNLGWVVFFLGGSAALCVVGVG